VNKYDMICGCCKAPLLHRNTTKTRIVDRAQDAIVGADT